MSVVMATLGCRLNFAKSETLKRLAGGETTVSVARPLVGTVPPVLLGNMERGHTDALARVFIAELTQGNAGPARITGSDDHLIGVFE